MLQALRLRGTFFDKLIDIRESIRWPRFVVSLLIILGLWFFGYETALVGLILFFGQFYLYVISFLRNVLREVRRLPILAYILYSSGFTAALGVGLLGVTLILDRVAPSARHSSAAAGPPIHWSQVSIFLIAVLIFLYLPYVRLAFFSLWLVLGVMSAGVRLATYVAYWRLRRWKRAFAATNDANALTQLMATLRSRSTWIHVRRHVVHDLGQLALPPESIAEIEDMTETESWLADELEQAIYNLRGRQVTSRDIEDTLDMRRQATVLRPRSVAAWLAYGNTLLRLHRFDDALSAYERALEIEPDNIDGWNGKARSLEWIGDYDGALEARSRVTALQPHDAWSWNLKGFVLSDLLGDYAAALEAYNRAIRLDGTLSSVWRNKAESLLKLERFSEALAASRRSLRIESSSVRGWALKARALLGLGRHQAALNAFKDALNVDVDDAFGWCQRGLVYKDLGQLDEALSAIEQAIVLAPEDPDYWEQKAELLSTLERFSDAVAAFDKALEYSPHSRAIRDKRAAVLQTLQGNTRMQIDATEDQAH
jgi:tetratricopeptide (TPR) repeat protein